MADASFFTTDVQTDDLRGAYDYAFARFGTMFFTTPGAAMRNVRKALKPGGVFSQIVWRKREDNPWLHDAELRVREIVPVVAHDRTSAVHCGPGPFCIGRDLDDAVEFAMALGPAGEIMRLAGAEGEALKPKVVLALRETLGRYVRADGVWAPSSTWFIGAHTPRARASV